jgi:hypothetical protein
MKNVNLNKIFELSSQLRKKGFEKQAAELEYQFLILKVSESKLYSVFKETGEDLINQFHPDGSFKVEEASNEFGFVETISDQHEKILKTLKDPTGKFANLVHLINKEAQIKPGSFYANVGERMAGDTATVKEAQTGIIKILEWLAGEGKKSDKGTVAKYINELLEKAGKVPGLIGKALKRGLKIFIQAELFATAIELVTYLIAAYFPSASQASTNIKQLSTALDDWEKVRVPQEEKGDPETVKRTQRFFASGKSQVPKLDQDLRWVDQNLDPANRQPSQEYCDEIEKIISTLDVIIEQSSFTQTAAVILSRFFSPIENARDSRDMGLIKKYAQNARDQLNVIKYSLMRAAHIMASTPPTPASPAASAAGATGPATEASIAKFKQKYNGNKENEKDNELKAMYEWITGPNYSSNPYREDQITKTLPLMK